MRWIKASERKPFSFSGTIIRKINTRQVIEDAFGFYDDHIRWKYGETVYFDNVEWLDEATPDPLTERLKAAELLIESTFADQELRHDYKKEYADWQQLKEQTKDILP